MWVESAHVRTPGTVQARSRRPVHAPAGNKVGAVSGEGELRSRLEEMVSSYPLLMRALHAARAVDAPDWLIGAGVIRDLVWDSLHGRLPEPPKDVDLVFFDPCALEEEREREIRAALVDEAPEILWDVNNQARVHLWYEDAIGVPCAPLRSSADGVATWPETASAIAVRLTSDDRIEVTAPLGLDDLFGLVCRRNPARVTLEEYRRRVHRKRVAERWPLVTVADDDR